MKSKVIAAVAVLTLGASLAVAAPEGGKFHGKRGRHGHFGAKFAKKLNLTGAQKEQIRTIRTDTREQNAAFFQSFRQARQELRAARKANDTARAATLAATLESQQTELKRIRQAQRERVLAVLTPEQRAQLER